MRAIRQLPNLLTMGNLMCGCFGILYVFKDPTYTAAYFVWAACLFDFLDGFAARLLKTPGALGKQLDSLADMVSFGVLPAMMMYSWINELNPSSWMAYGAFLIAIFSAMRLGKFNIDENQKESFVGVPTPANALFITGLVFLQPPFEIFTSSATSLFVITIIFSLLLVAPLNLFALKFKNYSWADNKLRFTFVGLSVLVLGLRQAEAIPLIILLYIALSLTGKAFTKH